MQRINGLIPTGSNDGWPFCTSPNEEGLRRERVEGEQKTRDKVEASDDEFTEEPVFPDNSYNNEVLAILFDYVGMLHIANASKK